MSVDNKIMSHHSVKCSFRRHFAQSDNLKIWWVFKTFCFFFHLSFVHICRFWRVHSKRTLLQIAVSNNIPFEILVDSAKHTSSHQEHPRSYASFWSHGIQQLSFFSEALWTGQNVLGPIWEENKFDMKLFTFSYYHLFAYFSALSNVSDNKCWCSRVPRLRGWSASRFKARSFWK